MTDKKTADSNPTVRSSTDKISLEKRSAEDPLSFRVVVADDEELARTRLEVLLSRAAESLKVDLQVSFAEDGASAIEIIQKMKPHIVFLDVQMPEVDGINVALNFLNRPFSLIFQTAHSEHAVKAFELSATDYLLKPYTSDRLEKALIRALKEQQTESQPPSAPPVSITSDMGNNDESWQDAHHLHDPLAKALAGQKIFLEHIAVKVGNRVRFVPIEEIKYFLSTEHVTQLYTSDCDYACDPSLSQLEERLPEKDFLRIHRNAIVRIKEIAIFQQEGNATVTLKNGVELRVSRERKRVLKEVMGI